MPADDRLLKMLQIAFVLAMISAFATAVSPVAVDTHVKNGDKYLHMMAFYGLTVFGCLAFPKGRPLIILIGMSAFGGLIEVVQGLSFIGRDRELADWIADTVATAAALIPLFVAPWRRRRTA